MATPLRTIPSTFPMLLPADVKAGRVIPASMFRRIAQAQNYLWANMRNIQVAHAFEGNDGLVTNRITDPANSYSVINREETTGSGRTGLKLAEFMVPANWAAGTRLKVTVFTTSVGVIKNVGWVEAQLFSMDGTAIGAPVTKNPDAGTNVRTDLLLDIPRNYGAVRCALYATHSFPWNVTVKNQAMTVTSFSARMTNGPADIFGVTPEQWGTTNDLAGNPDYAPATPFIGALFVRKIVNNTLSLWSKPETHICHGQLGIKTYNNTNASTVIGRWVVYAPFATLVSFRASLRNKSFVNAPYSIQIDGVTVASGTQASNTTTEDLAIGANISLAAGEHVVTFSANLLTTPSTDWGIILQRFTMRESVARTTTPAAPASFSPSDENDFLADKPWKLSHFNKFQQNDRWLYVNRCPIVFINETCQRTVKAWGWDSGVPNRVDARTQYTRHPYEDEIGVANSGQAPRNMTIGTDTVTNNNANFAVSSIPGHFGTPDADTHWGGAGTGYSTSPFLWPTSGSYPQGGNRLSLAWLALNAAPRRATFYWRARRLRTSTFVIAPTDGNDPYNRDSSYQGRGYLQLDIGGTLVTRQINNAQDWKSSWYLYDHQALIAANTKIITRGRMPPIVGYGGTAERPNEGMLYEIELQACCVVDSPFSQVELNAL